MNTPSDIGMLSLGTESAALGIACAKGETA